MIDLARVTELIEDIGAEEINEIVEVFISEVEEEIERLRNGNSKQTLEQSMHFLKGSALNLGFDKLADLCSTGEKLAEGGLDRDVDLAQIISTYQESRGQFLRRLANP